MLVPRTGLKMENGKSENHKIEKMRTILIFRTVSKCCFLVFILMQLQFHFFQFSQQLFFDVRNPYPRRGIFKRSNFFIMKSYALRF